MSSPTKNLKPKTKIFFHCELEDLLRESFEGLDSCPAQSAGKLQSCKVA